MYVLEDLYHPYHSRRSHLTSAGISSIFYNIEIQDTFSIPIVLTPSVLKHLVTYTNSLIKENNTSIFNLDAKELPILRVPIEQEENANLGVKTTVYINKYFTGNNYRRDCKINRVVLRDTYCFVDVGTILNRYGQPLVLATHDIKLNRERKTLDYESVTIHVNPIVYSGTDTVSRYIKNTYMPKLIGTLSEPITRMVWMIEGTIGIHTSEVVDNKAHRDRVHIDISHDIDRFFFRTPNREITDTDMKLNNLVLNKMKEASF